jgi:hypothetical protein
MQYTSKTSLTLAKRVEIGKTNDQINIGTNQLIINAYYRAGKCVEAHQLSNYKYGNSAYI